MSNNPLLEFVERNDISGLARHFQAQSAAQNVLEPSDIEEALNAAVTQNRALIVQTIAQSGHSVSKEFYAALSSKMPETPNITLCNAVHGLPITGRVKTPPQNTTPPFFEDNDPWNTLGFAAAFER